LTLKATDVKGFVEKATAQLISKVEFSGTFIGNKKCGFDHGSFDVSSLSPTATPTATATATATATPTTTPTATPTPTATATPLETKDNTILPPPPLAIDPPAPAAGSTVTITV